MQYDLSVVLPARNEMFLKQTIDDILKNKRAKTEIIAVLDGVWTNPPIPQHPDVNVIYVPESIGQRAATNLGVKLSRAHYIMKLDSHCSWDEGCDLKMLEGFKQTGDNVTAVPIMRNLYAFDWKCVKCGKKWYQGPTPTKCQETNIRDTGKPCDSKKFIRKIMWVGKERPQSTSYCFDAEPHFQYNNEYTKRPEFKKEVTETGFNQTMSLQGSCFMMTRDKYWELNICDENFGSWGNQGIEVAAKTWLSGGRVLVNHHTWYAHMFRTQGGDFSFPYQQSGKEVSRCKAKVRDMFWKNKYPKQVKPLSWLVEKFWPVKGWTQEQLDNLKKEPSLK